MLVEQSHTVELKPERSFISKKCPFICEMTKVGKATDLLLNDAQDTDVSLLLSGHFGNSGGCGWHADSYDTVWGENIGTLCSEYVKVSVSGTQLFLSNTR